MIVRVEGHYFSPVQLSWTYPLLPFVNESLAHFWIQMLHAAIKSFSQCPTTCNCVGSVQINSWLGSKQAGAGCPKNCCGQPARFSSPPVPRRVCFLGVGTDFNLNTTQRCHYQLSHAGEDKLKEALALSVSHFLLLRVWGLFWPSPQHATLWWRGSSCLRWFSFLWGRNFSHFRVWNALSRCCTCYSAAQHGCWENKAQALVEF